MKILSFVRYSLCVSVIAYPSFAFAEFSCSAEVSYKWFKASDVAATPGAAPVATPAPSTVHVASVEKVGADEAAAKASLAEEVARLRVKASEVCKRDHESFGECLGRKYTSHRSTIENLSFSARRDFEKALTEECRGQAGACATVSSSDPTCREVVKPSPEPAAPEKDKKADDKKKK